MRRSSRIFPSLLALCPALFSACSDADSPFSESASIANRDALAPAAKSNLKHDSPAAIAVQADAGSPAPSPSSTGSDTGVARCGQAACQCNNGIDDDGDGSIDGFDVECTGALDDEEQSFGTGIPGDNKDPKWQDCFFDGNSGAGDDRCRYPTGCLTGELAQGDPACVTSQACRDRCLPRTPAGCDCFGCCMVQLKGRDPVAVRLTNTCSAEKLGDADACPVCTPSASCHNDTPPAEPTDPDPTDPSDPPVPPPVSPDPEDPPAGTDPPIIR